MSIRAAASLAALALVAGTAGCAMTHHCEVPQPVVETASGSRIPLAVTVRHTRPPDAPTERLEQRDPYHKWMVDPAPPSRAMFDRLAASAFERVVPDPEGAATGAAPAGADAILEIRLDGVRFFWTPIGFDPYSATASYHAALRSADGVEITAFDIVGTGQRGPVLALATHCLGIGESVALAIQDAGSKLVARLSNDPALTAWLRTRGASTPALAIRPAESYAEPSLTPAAAEVAPYVPPGMTLGATAPPTALPQNPRPVTAPAARAPMRRAAHLSGGMGVFSPDETAGALEGPGTGMSLFIQAEARLLPYLAFATEGGFLFSSYSRATVAPGRQVGLGLSTWNLGLGFRAFLPGDGVEPWLGVMGRLFLTKAEEAFSFNMSMVEWPVAWSAGVDVGGGLRLYPGRGHAIGLEVRRIFARAPLDPYPGDVAIGGWTFGLSYGLSLPP